MKTPILIFTLQNAQACYASVIQFLQKLYRLRGSRDEHLTAEDLRNLKEDGVSEVYRFYFSEDIEKAIQLVPDNIRRENCLTEGMLERMDPYVREVGGQAFRFVLYVDAKSKSERFVDSFQYLLTAWQEYRGNIYFCIDNDTGNMATTQNIYFMVSHYLLFASLSGRNTHVDVKHHKIVNEDQQSFYNAIYAWNYLPSTVEETKKNPKRRLVRLALNGRQMTLSSFTKFYPLLPIDAETQYILTSSVRSVFQQDWSYDQFRQIILQQPVDLLHRRKVTDGYRKIALEMLKAMCLNYLLSAGELTQDDEENAENKKYLYNDMSMLGFFIYSVYLYYLTKQEKQHELTMDQKLALISDIQDFSAGMLQLVDNTVRHSSSKSGCFSMRIFSAMQGKSGLAQEYKAYLDKRGSDQCYYLEMRLIDSFLPDSDISCKTERDFCVMKSAFLRNLDARISEGTFEIEHATQQICKFRKKFEGATLRAFFDPGSEEETGGTFSIADWDAYYAVAENTLHHYGLMQFNAILKSHSGYFSVRSGTGYKSDESCYYDTEGGVGGKAYLPGTQYAVLLPIRMKLQQYATGFSAPEAEIDFSSLNRLTEEKCLEMPQKISELWEIYGHNSIEVSRGIYQYLTAKLVSPVKVYTFDFTALQQLDSVNGLNSILAREIFLKGLFYFIKVQSEVGPGMEKLHLAFYRCTHAALLETAELFCSFYNRSAKCTAMSGVEIYLSGEDCREDFLIAGEDLLAAMALANQVSFSKGRFSSLQSVLSCKIWNRFPSRSEQPADIGAFRKKLIPYDLIIKTDAGGQEYLFQSAVRKTLVTDLQSRDHGCCVHNSHVRVGSKIHVSDRFYEAQELFHTSQYLSRFAYLVAKKIVQTCAMRQGRIMLVGYETYSELLILSVERMLEMLLPSGEGIRPIHVDHVIYENMPGTQPVRLRTGMDDKDALTEEDMLVLVVPINSTLSTHSKIKATLEKDRRFEACAKAGILKNFGLILIRHGETDVLTDEERQYWKSIQCSEHTITAPKLIEPAVEYIISVKTEWENPLLCRCCYPADHKKEVPLIGTNKASVIPTYLIGLTESGPLDDFRQNGDTGKGISAFTPFSRQSTKKERKSIQNLFAPGAYFYGHIRYYGNDFQFYFDTELILNRILKDSFLREKLDAWIAEVRTAIFSQSSEVHLYNVVIAPEQPQNAGWIDYVSRKLFSDSSDILHFDIQKEFRDNIKTKFSNISALYTNLVHADKSATIHFHFVDSSLCTGRTIERARSLIQSLFPAEALNGTGNVRVKIFDSILVLLNRSSSDSQRSYINGGQFFSFLSLNIPNLRNHQDACVLCNLVQEFNNLERRAASNEIAQEWRRRAKKLQVHELEPLDLLRRGHEMPSSTPNQGREFRRLVCSQQAYVGISELGYKCNRAPDILDMLWNLCYFSQINSKMVRKSMGGQARSWHNEKIWGGIKACWNEPKSQAPSWVTELADKLNDAAMARAYFGDLNSYVEMLISYIKVFSRPFLIFRKSVIEASFQWRLLLLDTLLTGSGSNLMANAALIPVYALYQEAWAGGSSSEGTYRLLLALFKALIGSLTKNGSNFIIRGKNYDLISRYYSTKLKPLLPRERQEPEQSKFQNWYLCNVKRLIDSNRDETKSLWLHYLLLTGTEPSEQNLNLHIQPESRSLSSLQGLSGDITAQIYLENNRIIYDGIVDIYNNDLSFETFSTPVPYYLENFVRFICWDYGIPCAQNPLSEENSGNAAYEQVNGLVDLYKALRSQEGGSEEFYDKLKVYIKKASGADYVELLGATQTEDSLKQIKSALRDKYYSVKNPSEDDEDWKKLQQIVQEKKGVTPYAVGGHSQSGTLQFAESRWVQQSLQYFANTDYSPECGERLGGSVLLNADNGYIMAKIDPGGQDDGQAGVEPLYLALYRKDGDRFALLRGMRNVLTFRFLFVERLKLDFNNSLMLEFALARDKAEYLGQSRAAGHTQSAIINLLVNQLSSENDPDLLRGYAIRGLADQTCSHWYSEYVSNGNIITYSEKSAPPNRVTLYSIVKALSSMDFQILAGDARDVSYKRNGRLWLRGPRGNDWLVKKALDFSKYLTYFEGWNKIFLSGNQSDVIAMFVLLIINACRHGECDAASVRPDQTQGHLPSKVQEDENMDIVLSCDGKYVILTNPILLDPDKDIVAEMKKNAYQRPNRDEGISVWVINEFFKRMLISTYFSSLQRKLSDQTSLEEIKKVMDRIQNLEQQCLIFDCVKENAHGSSEKEYPILQVKIPVYQPD